MIEDRRVMKTRIKIDQGQYQEQGQAPAQGQDQRQDQGQR